MSIGIAKRHMLNGSTVGVIIAAMTNISTTAYFLFFLKNLALTIFNLLKSHTAIGISKTAPQPKIKATTKEIYLLIEITATKSVPAMVSRNFKEIGIRTKYPKQPPVKKAKSAQKTKVCIYFLCFSSRAGEINFHI